MNSVIFCVGILTAICAWGFLLAGALAFNAPEKSSLSGIGKALVFVDFFVSLCLLTMLQSSHFANYWVRRLRAMVN